MCGGQVTLFVHELVESAREPLAFAHAAIAEGRPVALATLLDGPSAGSKLALTEDDSAGTLGSTPLLDTSVRRDARGFLDQGLSVVRRYSAKGEEMGDDVRVYIQSFATPPRMIIFGAIDFSAAIAGFAGELGYRVTICDARPPFAQSKRFSAVADVVIDWPDRFLAGQTLGPRDVVLVFTHDAKFDEPALTAALATNAGYIGALGSRRTQEDREARLREAGATDADIARISAPCGLDVGARTPHETAISILAEIIARAAGRDGRRLDQASGPIHPERVPVT
jgi:xanthine dehydrogenase accessory factor